MLKTLNPSQTYFYAVPGYEKTVFEFRAFAGPINVDLTSPDEILDKWARKYLQNCIVSVTDIEIPIVNKANGETVMTYFEHWTGSPKVDWTNILPSSLCNKLVDEIAKVSRLLPEEKVDFE